MNKYILFQCFWIPSSSQAKGTKSTSYVRSGLSTLGLRRFYEVDLVPLAYEDGIPCVLKSSNTLLQSFFSFFNWSCAFGMVLR